MNTKLLQSFKPRRQSYRTISHQLQCRSVVGLAHTAGTIDIRDTAPPIEQADTRRETAEEEDWGKWGYEGRWDPYRTLSDRQVLDKAKANPNTPHPHRDRKSNYGIVEAYLSMRLRNRYLLASLNARVVLAILNSAIEQSLYGVVDELSADVIDLYNVHDRDRRIVLRQFLLESHRHPTIFRHYRVLHLFRAARKLKDNDLNLPATVPTRIAQAFLSVKPHEIEEGDIPFIVNMASDLVHSYGNYSEDATSQQPLGGPPDDHPAWLAIRLTRVLTQLGEYKHANNVLSFLFKAGLVREDSLDDVLAETSSLADVGFLMDAALVRSCLYLRWNGRAQELALQMSGNGDHSWNYLSSLSSDIVRACLETESREEIEICGFFIARAVSAERPVVLADDLIRRFYQLAYERRLDKVAEDVYIHLRSNGVRSVHDYPLPPGVSLPWIMRQMIQRRKDLTNARRLAVHAAEEGQEILVSSRAPFIALCASEAFAVPARTLWERYSEGPHRDMVVGHAKLMLRLVKLFASLSREQLEMRRPGGTNSNLKRKELVRHWPDSSTGEPQESLGVATSTSIEMPGKQTQTEDLMVTKLFGSADAGFEEEEAEDEGLKEEGVFLSKSASDVSPTTGLASTSDELGRGEGKGVAPPSLSHGMEELDASERSSLDSHAADRIAGSEAELGEGSTSSAAEEEDEYLQFARRVLQAFEEEKQPLEGAHHMALNALGRAHTILGNPDGCLRAMSIILARQEVPDMFDLNVVLAAVAASQPRQAASMIQRMIQHGLKPDTVTFTTVLDSALKDEDGKLVGKLLFMARSMGHEDLSDYACGSLIRATLRSLGQQLQTERDSGEGWDSGEESAAEGVRRAYWAVKQLVGTREERSAVDTPKMGRELVGAAVGVGEAEIAYWVWARLVRGRVAEARELGMRRAIGALAQRQLRAGELSRDRVRHILTGLGERHRAG